MFMSDELAMNYIAIAILVAFPWLGIALGTWGFIWEILILLAVFYVGRRRGVFMASAFIAFGYATALISTGVTSLSIMGFVPLAGLLAIFGWSKHWPIRVSFFWSAALAGVLGAAPTLSFVMNGINVSEVTDFTNLVIQQYQTTDLTAMLQQQGVTQVQFQDTLHQVIGFYFQILPGLASIVSLAEFGLVFYFIRRWFKDNEGRIPFSQWRLPWYAIWGAILGIAFYLIGDQYSWLPLRGVGINLIVVYGAVTLVLGVSVYLSVLLSPRIPRLLKLGIIVITVFYTFFGVFSLMMFGLFDLVFNFRRLPEDSDGGKTA